MAAIFNLIKTKMSTGTLTYTNVHSNQFCYELKYGTADAAGLDLYLTNVDNSHIVASNGTVIGKMYGTNIAVEIPRGYVGQLYLRSSGGKAGFSMLNHVGIIDSDYRGEIKAMLYYPDIIHAPIRLPTEKAILQLVIVPAPQFSIVRADSLTTTPRGSGGFGSTNVVTASFPTTSCPTTPCSTSLLAPTFSSSLPLSKVLNSPDPEFESIAENNTFSASNSSATLQTSLNSAESPALRETTSELTNDSAPVVDQEKLSKSMQRFNEFTETLPIPVSYTHLTLPTSDLV